jgi:hypothetical protein
MKTAQKIQWHYLGDTKYSREQAVGCIGDTRDRYHIVPIRSGPAAGPYRGYRASYNYTLIGDFASRGEAVVAAEAHHEKN